MKTKQRYVGIVGHRGAGVLAPENSLAGIRLAARLGANMVELDVRTSRDGVPVIMHDALLRRTTGDPRPVSKLTWAQLRQLDNGSWFNRKHPRRARPEYARERVPSLEQAIRLCRELGLAMFLDHKRCEPDLLQRVLRENDYLDHVLLNAGYAAGKRFKKALPGLAVQVPASLWWPRRGLFRPDSVDSHWNGLTPEMIAYCHGRSIAMIANVLGTESTDELLAAGRAGVLAVQTDRPDLMVPALERAGMRHGRFRLPWTRSKAKTPAAEHGARPGSSKNADDGEDAAENGDEEFLRAG